MKKITALLVVLTLMLSVLAGCRRTDNDGGLPDGMSGKDAAKLILANERLNSQLLKNSGNIFAGGADVLRTLSDKTLASLAGNTVVTDPEVAKIELASNNYEAADGSTVEIDGNLYTWSGFTEYSNSYEYFLNLTGGISSSATVGADLIDHVKKYVRVVDKWVDQGGVEYYLHVEENCEVLYERNDVQIKICRRTRGADGVNLYEVFTKSSSSTTRMSYIPGRLCEYSAISGSFNHNFLAENSKGFWEVVDVGVHDTHYNVSCMVIKNDICYDAFYEPSEENRGIGTVKIVSADRKTDILDYTAADGAAFITVKLQAFDGYARVEKISDTVTTPHELKPGAVVKIDGDVYSTQEATLVLDGGRRINVSDRFLSGAVEVSDISVSYFSREPEKPGDPYGGGYVPTINLRVSGNGFAAQMETLDAFLAECGLSCKRDMNYVKAGILRAFEELAQFTKYHEWNESPIRTEEDIARGWENNLAKHAAYNAMYGQIKDAEVIRENMVELELHVKFAPITAETSASVTNSGMAVEAKGVELTVEDTTLFVVGEKYTVGFALLESEANGGGLIHTEATVSGETEFVGSGPFTVKADGSFTLPEVDEGEYKIVAYIETADGIRTSAYTELKFTALTPASVAFGNVNATLVSAEDGSVSVKCTASKDIDVSVKSGTHTHASMTEALSEQIYRYAFVATDAVLEVEGEGGSFIAVAESDEPLASGTYRLKYEIKNGSTVTEGYAYVEYTA